MKKVHILVEGQTEETFIKSLVQPHLYSFNIFLNPVIIATKKVKSGKKFKGGIISYQKVKNELQKLLSDSSAITVTTMIDYYGLPIDFPGYSSIPNGSCYQRVSHLTKKFQENINHPRFLPFLTLHEFEAFLFVSPEKFGQRFPSIQIINELKKIRDNFSSPEEINDGQDTHPSARIKLLINKYKKVVDGIIIAEKIGLEKIRAKCRHFNQWLSQLEQL
jgi:hypothetical protein